MDKKSITVKEFAEETLNRAGVLKYAQKDEDGGITGFDIPGVGVVVSEPKVFFRLHKGFVAQMKHKDPATGELRKLIFYPDGDLEIVRDSDEAIVREKAPVVG